VVRGCVVGVLRGCVVGVVRGCLVASVRGCLVGVLRRRVVGVVRDSLVGVVAGRGVERVGPVSALSEGAGSSLGALLRPTRGGATAGGAGCRRGGAAGRSTGRTSTRGA